MGLYRVTAIAIVLSLASFGVWPATAVPAPSDLQTPVAVPSPPAAPLVREARTRLRVTPGRKLYRDCTSWLARENRPSGPVLVPRLRCWWVYG